MEVERKGHKSGADDYEGDPSIGAEVSVQPHPHRHYHDQIEEEVERLIAGYFFKRKLLEEIDEPRKDFRNILFVAVSHACPDRYRSLRSFRL